MKRFIKGFVWAGNGIFRCIREERNFRFHLCAGFAVLYFAARYYTFVQAEWAVLILTIFGVLVAEAMNTAIERACALPDKQHDSFAGRAKDIAAGAALLACVAAVIIGILLFWRPAVFADIRADFIMHPVRIAVFICYILASYLFVFVFHRKGTKK